MNSQDQSNQESQLDCTLESFYCIAYRLNYIYISVPKTFWKWRKQNETKQNNPKVVLVYFVF